MGAVADAATSMILAVSGKVSDIIQALALWTPNPPQESVLNPPAAS
jgi:hypothetical protein